MKYRKLGHGPWVSALGLGCMGMSESYGPYDENLSIEVIRQAFNQGITFFDTADAYGNGHNEILLGKAVKPFREQVVIATKCGIDQVGEKIRINNTRDYIKQACDKSLERLGFETIDLYYLHRYNPDVPIEDSMRTMQELINEGKIRYVGLSEVGADIIERAYKILGNRLVAVQTEYSIVNHAQAEAVLSTCKKLEIAFIAWSPLARGMLSGKLRDDKVFTESQAYDFRSILPQFQGEAFRENLHFVDAIAAIAEKKQCTSAQLALAWLLAQENVIPIPGTKKLEYLQENIKAINIDLTVDELEAINEVIQENPISGARYPDELMKLFNLSL
jgi:aryl-alcohol dehydrogenase-like predicted oxidoreductase